MPHFILSTCFFAHCLFEGCLFLPVYCVGYRYFCLFIVLFCLFYFNSELRLDSQCHHQCFRMSAEQMDELLSLIGPEVTRQSTNYRAAIEPKQRLAVALR